jgi:predicted helicase
MRLGGIKINVRHENSERPGKTLVSLWLAERIGATRVLVLVPSLAVVRQTLHGWLKETSWVRPRFIAVCSDPTVTTGVKDAVIVHQRNLDFPVTTDSTEVREFLAASRDRVQIVFSTYQSFDMMARSASRERSACRWQISSLIPMVLLLCTSLCPNYNITWGAF